MSLSIDIAGNQIDGARDYQEDAFLITHLGDQKKGEATALVIVADGMGGHAAGNVASNMAVQAFNKHFTQYYDSRETHQLLLECIQQANNAIAETVRETAALRGMGCTLVASYFENGNMWSVSVGDSHSYLIREGKLKKLNADHSYGGFLDRMAAAGKPVEAEEGFARNMLMSALTGDEIADIDCPSEPTVLQADDRILLASDGLDTLSHGKIIYFSGDNDTPKSCSDSLIQGVTEADMPRQDNTTVVVIDVEDTEAAEAAPEPEKPAANKPTSFDREDPTTPQATVASLPDKPTTRPEVDSHDERPKKTGLIMAVAGIVLVAIAAAVYMYMQPSSPVPVVEPIIEMTESTSETEEIIDEEMEPSEPEEPEIMEPEAEEPEPEMEVVTEPAETIPTPVAQTSPAVTAKEFQDPLSSGGLGPVMLSLPTGSFGMGGSSHKQVFDELPNHKVTLPAFAIGKYEVSIAQYEQFAKAEGRKLKVAAYQDKNTYPIINVTWEDAFYYAKWLSKQTGNKYRLPSEAEWEYAARGGTTTDYWWGFKIGQANAHCAYCGTPFKPREAAPSGSFKPNPFGLYDTSGNVSEWVHDCFHKDYTNAPDDGSVWEGGDCNTRLIRGGSFDSAPPSLRSSKRDRLRAASRYNNVGFRIVREQ